MSDSLLESIRTLNSGNPVMSEIIEFDTVYDVTEYLSSSTNNGFVAIYPDISTPISYFSRYNIYVVLSSTTSFSGGYGSSCFLLFRSLSSNNIYCLRGLLGIDTGYKVNSFSISAGSKVYLSVRNEYEDRVPVIRISAFVPRLSGCIYSYFVLLLILTRENAPK